MTATDPGDARRTLVAAHDAAVSALLVADPRAALELALEADLPALSRRAELYVRRANLARLPGEISALADDVVQEAVTRALARSNRFDPTRSALAWLSGFVLNVIREERRRRARGPLPVEPPSTGGEDAPRDPFEWIEDLAASADLALVELLSLIGPAERRVLEAAYVDNLSGPALAERLRVSQGAARVQVSRAVRRLADAYRGARLAPDDSVRTEERR